MCILGAGGARDGEAREPVGRECNQSSFVGPTVPVLATLSPMTSSTHSIEPLPPPLSWNCSPCCYKLLLVTAQITLSTFSLSDSSLPRAWLAPNASWQLLSETQLLAV